MPGLGRLFAPDVRDGRFLLREHPRTQQVALRLPAKTWPMFSLPLDQGNTGTCVGHGWRHLLTAVPVVVRPNLPPSAFDIYDWATQLDEWTDNDHDAERQYGTSVRAGAKALQTQGKVGEYRWTNEVDEAADWIAGVDAQGKAIGGPVVIGINFYASMFDLDSEGYMRIAPNTVLSGGHCMLLLGWNQERGAFRGLNSWGVSWGQRGRFWLDGDTARRLFTEDGEICVATEARAA